MATAETVDLGPAHPPKEDSIEAFNSILLDIKKNIVHLRHDYAKHEKEYFAAVEHLSDHDLAGFSTDDLESVRVAVSAYGIHLFGKVRIPAMPESGPAYIHFRAFIAGSDEPPKLHSVHTEERDEEGGGKTFRAIFTKDDALEWFDT
ncbi:Fc.00g069710.m01.CDS01 [Cosmosporella sp. VM-42]